MRQRVNIAYSIDIEDLEEETLRLWNKVETQIGRLLSVPPVSEFQQNILTLQSLGSIEVLRQQLNNIDYALDDLSKIINGYIQYQANGAAPSAPAEKIDELVHKIQEFKEQSTNT